MGIFDTVMLVWVVWDLFSDCMVTVFKKMGEFLYAQIGGGCMSLNMSALRK